MRLDRGILLAVAGILCLGTASAENTFLPNLVLTESYTDSVSIGGGIGQGESDLTTELGLQLPFVHNTKRGSVGFTYAPSYVWYQEYDDLNNDQHRFTFGGKQKPNAKSQLTYRASYVRTQAAPNLASSLNEEEAVNSEFTFLANNTQIESYNVSAGYQRTIRQGWTWSASVGGVESQANNLDSTDPGDGFVDTLEDTRSYRGTFSMSRQFSRENALGFGYNYNLFEQQTGDADVHELTLNYERSKGEQWRFGVRAGGYSQSQDGPGGDSGEGFTGRLTASRIFRKVTLQLAGTQAFTTGGNLEGTAVNTFGIFSAVGRFARVWRWNGSTLYGVNKPQLETTGERTNKSANLGLAWVPVRKPFELQLRTTYQDRKYEDPDGNVLEGISGDFTTVALSVNWKIPGIGRDAGR